MTVLQAFMCWLILDELFVMLLIERAARRQLNTIDRPEGGR
jgi:hypothetical protein